MGNKKKEQSPILNRHVSELTSKPYKSRVKSQGLKANLRISLMPNAQSLILLTCRLYCG